MAITGMKIDDHASMKKQGESLFMRTIAILFCVVFSFATAGLAQVAERTVTNEDLERFRQQRVAADREYRATYAQKGMPSPEEIERRSEERVKTITELAEKIRADYLERERLAVERARIEQSAPRIYINTAPPSNGNDNFIWSYPYPYPYFDPYRFNPRFRNRFYVDPLGGGYVSGGVLWPGPRR
jgi:hypothetical protein